MYILELLKQYSTLEEIPRFANRQGVAALLYDEVVESEVNPFDKSGLIRLSGYAQKQAKKWEIQKDSINTVAQFCNKNGIGILLFKGYSVSLLYKNPNSRKSGDVDVFFFEFNQQNLRDKNELTLDSTIFAGNKVDKLLCSRGKQIVRTKEKHSKFNVNDTLFENHSFFLNNDTHPKLLIAEKYLRKQKMLQSKEWNNIYYPNQNFNAVFLPLHAAEHFIYSGASLRQLIDWPMFLQHSGNEVEWSEVYALADRTGFRKWLDILNTIAINKFGVSTDCIGGSKYFVPNEMLEDKVISAFIHNEDIDDETPFLKLFYLKTLKQIKNKWKFELVYNENFYKSYINHSFCYLRRIIKKKYELIEID